MSALTRLQSGAYSKADVELMMKWFKWNGKRNAHQLTDDWFVAEGMSRKYLVKLRGKSVYHTDTEVIQRAKDIIEYRKRRKARGRTIDQYTVAKSMGFERLIEDDAKREKQKQEIIAERERKAAEEKAARRKERRIRRKARKNRKKNRRDKG